MIVLDTHVWLWWGSRSRKLPVRVKRKLEQSRRLGVCAISCWEVSMLVARGRLKLDRHPFDWVRAGLSLPGVELLPLEPEVAVAASQVAFDGDPADHMIVSTAQSLRAPVATADEAIHECGLVEVIW